ncbi:Ser/Thr protein phosphatase, putative [Trichomonas vaginalis G3]|uniref:Serine/threonine-protein phosphatase n=1 Tax=Trichomonas vaginalis (strain ATCC PRA-98 / G3) TaxID=412133 RepID=A2G1G7_TRIV3|nr:serine threonine-protein phosphatase family [Trichomonas vaginalis G3]EAX89002.1 Ser/Thr protein phosphatase, putative [Trichomonas vaginalis G3]KAI5482233.1 serine threonine-protein phosphatase family [Trichomonas vaginalis G3]|eukprot:XP_001301932.1 Ser/Thr protein phosphatase [Trichomonas vaginalis G3]
MSTENIDKYIEVLKQGKHLQEAQISEIFSKFISILEKEDNLLRLEAPINVVGDIHGQLFDLLNMFDLAEKESCEKKKFLFLGDYVDRGHFSIETIALLACLKIKSPNDIFMLRGNHESPSINQVYGFYNNCLELYGSSMIWILANKTFQHMPMAALINEKFFCIHGGLSPELRYVDQLYVVDRVCEIPETGILADLTWSDPDDSITKYGKSKRGSGHQFGRPQVEEFIQNNNLQLIIRSHQLAMKGYEEFFMKDDKPQLLTVWSAPNYCYTAGNKATFMAVDKDLNYRLIEFESGQEPAEELDPTICPYFA